MFGTRNLPPDRRIPAMRRLLFVLVPVALLWSIAATAHGAPLAPASRQVLKVGVFQPAERGNLDPSQLSYLDAINMSRLMFLPLYEERASGTLKPVLASGQPIVSRDGRTVTVRLRAARWSDGVPITAANVVTAYTRSRSSYFHGFLAGIRSVTAVNARTVRFTLRARNGVTPALMTLHILSPLPTHVVNRARNRWTNPGTVVASGPFRLTARTASKWTFVKNPRYFGARHVRLARVEVYVPRSRATLLAGMRNGSYATTLQSSFTPSTSFAGTKVVTQNSPTEGMQYLYINTKTVTDARVRRAIALAVDRAGIVGITGGGVGTSIAPDNMPLAGTAIAGARLLSSSGAPDVAGAQAQLAGAAVPSRALRLIYSRDSGFGLQVATKVRDSLAAIGITVTLVPLSSDVFSTAGYGISPTRSDVDLALQGWIVDYPDLWDYYQLFVCSNVRAGINTSNACDGAYDRLTSGLAAQYRPAGRGAIFAKLEQYLTGPSGSFPAVPLYRQDDRVYRQSWLRAPLPSAAGYIQWDRMAIEVH
jgi:peptide/nickel transport system substrate-binding protein